MLLWPALLCALCFNAHAQLRQEHMDLFFADVTFEEDGDSWVISADGIPRDQDASELLPNPNQPSAQDHSYRFYKTPLITEGETTCTTLGPIGFGLNGVPFYNALTGGGCDAVISEDFDDCLGHASPNGAYHYHQLSHCVHDEDPETPLQLHGVAIDGVLIYGPVDADGVTITNDRLDECHGSSDILPSRDYAYFMTDEFPYIIGCYKATVQDARGGCFSEITNWPYTNISCANGQLEGGDGGGPPDGGPPDGGPPGGGPPRTDAPGATNAPIDASTEDPDAPSSETGHASSVGVSVALLILSALALLLHTSAL